MDKGCVLCEIQTKILYTVGTNVCFQGVCHGWGAEGRFPARSGQVEWWAHCHWDGFSPVRFSAPLPFHLCFTFGSPSKVACNRTSWQNQQMWYSFGNRRTPRKKSASVLQFSEGKPLYFIAVKWRTWRTILFYVFIYIFNSLHVSSTSCSSSGETNCVNTTSGSCHSVSVAVSCAGWKW